MQKSPFKFLDSYTKDDLEIFFGRDDEIKALYSAVFTSKILLVYGVSGCGKSSLLNCGLANKFNDTDWLPVSIRRGNNINQSLLEALFKCALTKAPFEKKDKNGDGKISVTKALQSVYLDHFRPIYLIFDQFEELFIFGSKEEKTEFIRNVKKIVDSDIQCRLIISIREEYLAGVTEFEKVIPTFLSNRIRIEKMTRQNAIQAIEGPCRVNSIEVEQGFSEALLDKLNPESPEIELTYLQVFLDRIYKQVLSDKSNSNRFTIDILNKQGDVKDLLGSFLEEQISQLDDPETGLVILKSFVSVKGTKHQITEDEAAEYSRTLGKSIDQDTLKNLIQKFIGLRILRDKDENGKYELRHDTLATKIYEKITLVEKELLEIRQFIDNAYNNYEKREVLLNAEDISYIAPYEDKLFLNDKLQRFLNDSKREIHKAKRRRQNALIITALVIIAVLSFFTIWAFTEKKNAFDQQKIAENQKNEAVKSKEEAETAKQEALVMKKHAEDNEKLAIAAKNQSEEARREALIAKEIALKEKNRAEQLSVVANEQAQNAEREKQVADTQRIIAQSAEEKARRLSILSTAQNLALKSMTMEKNPELTGLLAVQAFNFNISNGGSIDDPVIYEALSKAFSTLDSSKHSILTGPLYEMRSIAENGNALVSVDMDGRYFSWLQDGSGRFKIISDKTPLISIDFISLSPGGNKMVINYESNKLILKRIYKEENSELQGHTGTVKAADWSNDGNYLVTGGRDSLIKIWDTSTKPIVDLITFKAPSAIKDIAFCNADTVISAHDDGSIILWIIHNSTSELLYSPGTEKPLCIAWNGSKKTLMAGCTNGTLFLIDVNHVPYRLSRFSVHSSGIDQIAFSNDFTLMATASWDKLIRLYNYHEFFEMSNSVIGAINFDNLNARARSLFFTADKKLVAGMSDKSIRIWETSSEKLVSLICGLAKRDMTTSEWTDNVGIEIPYEKTCKRTP
jgi:WD40 repeat protein